MSAPIESYANQSDHSILPPNLDGLAPEAPQSPATWPLPDREMRVFKGMLEYMVEAFPDNAYTETRKRVLENWPNIRPIMR